MTSPKKNRRGLVLVVVLIAVTLLSLAAYSFTELMVSERIATDQHGRGVQARMLVDSGLDYAKAFLAYDYLTREDAGGTYDNPAMFQGALLIDANDPRDRGRFSFVSPLWESGEPTGMVRYGFESESARLNLNVLPYVDKVVTGGGREILMALPGMTEDIADSILDWLDEDDEQREYGAEYDYYESLSPPYTPRNGPLESVEELLLVRGVEPYLLYGADGNRNFTTVEPSETEMANELSGLTTMEGYYGSMESGWAAYLTVYSQELNVTSDGLEKIDLNASDLEQLHADLESAFGYEWATFIIAYRQAGPYNPQANQGGGGEGGGDAGGGDGGSGSGGGGNNGQGNPGGGGSNGGGSDGQGGGGGPSGGGRGGGGGSGGGGQGGGGGPSGGSNPGQSGGQQSNGGNGGGSEQQASNNPQEGEEIDGRELDLTQSGNTRLTSILDLIDARVQVQFQGEEEPVVLRALFPNNPVSMSTYLPLLMDQAAVNTSPKIPGRININQAPRIVLLGIPGMTESIVDEIIYEREPEPIVDDINRRHETWLLTEAIVTLDEMKQLMPFITARGDVYRTQVVGFFDQGGPARRIEAVIDASEAEPVVLFWKDLSALGRGFSLGTLGAELSF